MGSFVRFQSPERSSPLGVHIGVFGLVNMLGRQGWLTEDDEALRRDRNQWFDDAYTDPSTVDASVYDRQINPGAVAWFRATSVELIAATREHCSILDRYDVAWERVESGDPGRVVYEDEHQVVAVPHAMSTV